MSSPEFLTGLDSALNHKEIDNTVSFPSQHVEGVTWRGRIVKFINFILNLPHKIYQLLYRVFESGCNILKKQTPVQTKTPQIEPSNLSQAVPVPTPPISEKIDFAPQSVKPAASREKEIIVEKSVEDQILDYIRSSEKREELADLLPDSNYIVNTKLGKILVDLAFDLSTYEAHHKNLNKLLKILTNDAKKGNQAVQRALTLPNNPGEEIKEKKVKNGFPQNTPLALLIKMQNQVGAIEIVQVYSKEDLLFKNPLGNTVLHLAVGTGQLEIAKAILARAEELGIKEELLAVKNCLDKTAQDIYKHLKDFGRPTAQDKFSSCSPIYFGGEEGNKSNIGNAYMAIVLKEIKNGSAPESFFS